MNDHTTGRNDDSLILMLSSTGFIALGGIPLVLGSVLPEVQSWLLEHRILLPADQAQLILPGTETGLDFLRLVILAGLLCTAAVLTAFTAKRRRSAR